MGDKIIYGVVRPKHVANIPDKAAANAVGAALGLTKEQKGAIVGGDIIKWPDGDYYVRTKVKVEPDGEEGYHFIEVDPENGIGKLEPYHSTGDGLRDVNYKKGSAEKAREFIRMVGTCTGIFEDKVNDLREQLGLPRCE